MLALMSHQKEMVNHALDNGKVLWYSEMGTGKTAALLDYLGRFSGMRLVVCPKPSIGVFEEDWYKLGFSLRYPDTAIITLRKGNSKDKQKQLDNLADSNVIVVVNYATARLLKYRHLPITAAGADEAQKVGAYNSKTSLTLARQHAHIPYKVAMTGTPYHDRLDTLFGVFRWLDPLIYDNPRKYPGAALFGHWHDFMRQYCTTYTHNNVEIISGYKNTDKLAAQIKPYTLRITSDVLDLPPAVSTVHKVGMRGAWARAYRDLADNASIEIDGNTMFAPHVLQRTIRLQQVACSGVVQFEDGTTVELDIKPRLDVFRALMDELDGRPVVVFTRFKRDIDLLQDQLSEPCAKLTGDIDTHTDWKQGKYRVLLANISAGGVGVRLERAAHIVFWSVGWSRMEYEQALGRIRRMGQTAGRVFFHHIVTDNSIDAQIYEAFREKAETQHKVDEGLS